MMKKGFTASKNGTWEEYKETFKEKVEASERAFDRIKEAFDFVAKDEVENMSIVQEIMFKKYGLLAANHCARRRTRRCHDVVLVP